MKKSLVSRYRVSRSFYNLWQGVVWLLKMTARFRKRPEAGSLQTFMHSSTCSCCSFDNASPQFITSRPITFAPSSILWSLNYLVTDWSWGTAGVMLTLPWHCTECPAARRAEGTMLWWREGGRQGGMHTMGWRAGAGSRHRSRDKPPEAQREADKTSNPNWKQSIKQTKCQAHGCPYWL